MPIDIRQAEKADDAQLTALQARCPQGTSIVMKIVNVPTFFSRARIYENSRVYVACEGDRIVGSGACAIRNAIVGDAIAPVGYVFEAFVAPESRRKGVAGQLLKRREDHLRREGAALAYTLIMEGNIPSMRYIERQAYKRRRTFVIAGLHVFREMTVPDHDKIRPAVRNDLEAIGDLLNQTWRNHSLYEPVSAASLNAVFARTPGFSLNNLVVREEAGEIVACVGCWDWANVMEITVLALSARMRFVSLLINAARLFRTMPDSIKPGTRLSQIMLTPIGFRDASCLGALVRHVNNVAARKHADIIYCVSEPGHALLKNLSGFFRVYTDIHLYIKPLREGVRLHDPIYINGMDL